MLHRLNRVRKLNFFRKLDIFLGANMNDILLIAPQKHSCKCNFVSFEYFSAMVWKFIFSSKALLGQLPSASEGKSVMASNVYMHTLEI